MRKPWLAELYLYPLKGGRGIPLLAAPVDSRGLRFDRRWLVVRPDGTFLTQRTHPKLALIAPALTPEALHLSAPGLPPLTLPFEATGERRVVRIWRDTSDALGVPSASAWLGELLGEKVELVFMPEDAQRKVEAHGGRDAALVSFADAYPFLLVSRASLADLNSRLQHPLPMNRFRPNLVITGTTPFAEDSWKQIRVGELLLDVVKGCARCAVTTVDQRSGRPDGPEPLKTLATFRRHDGEVWFAQNAVHHAPGRLRVGDPVEVLA